LPRPAAHFPAAGNIERGLPARKDRGGPGPLDGSAGRRFEERMNQPEIPQRKRPLSPEAEQAQDRPKEVGGPQGPEPTRYGDWEHNGLTSDF